MFNKPIRSFFISLVLFLLVLAGEYKSSSLSLQASKQWILLIAASISFCFSLISVISGIKQINRKESSFFPHLFALIGSTVILIALSFIGFLMISLIVGGFPQRD